MEEACATGSCFPPKYRELLVSMRTHSIIRSRGEQFYRRNISSRDAGLQVMADERADRMPFLPVGFMPGGFML
jgi:hypothetical protein